LVTQETREQEGARLILTTTLSQKLIQSCEIQPTQKDQR
jgi:hypothetical protein